MRARVALVLAAGALAATGCGGADDDDAASTPAPARTATATATPTETPAAPEAQPGGAGDEEPIRQRVRLTVGEDGISPARVKVLAYFGVRLTVRNATTREQIVTVVGAEPRRALSVGKGVTGTLDLEPLRPGRYVVEGGSAGRATLVSSVDEP